MCKVSIIMPVFNVADYLERSISFIRNQTYDNWELILVNDGSIDESGKICEKFAKIDNRITVIHQENRGAGPARQTGIDNSTGEFICFVDPDDYLHTDALKGNIEIMRKYKVQLIVNGYYRLKKNGKGIVIKEEKSNSLNGIYTKKEFRNNYDLYVANGSRPLWNKLYQKKLIIENNIKFSSYPIGEDVLFNQKVHQAIESIYISPNMYYVYDTTRDNSAVKLYRSDRLENELKLINEHIRMLKNWRMYEKYEHIILSELFDALIYELSNLFYTKNDLTFKEKIKLFKKHTSKKHFKYMFNYLTKDNIKTVKMKIVFYLIKYNLTNLVLLFYQIKSWVRN